MSISKIDKAQAALTVLRESVLTATIPRAAMEWGGAHVVVCQAPTNSGYREIVTPYSLEVSWLIEQLRDIFFDGLIDAGSKYEFFGRLELAANKSIGANHGDVGDISRAMLNEAEAMLAELSRRDFHVLSVAEGSEIAADRLKQ